MVSKTEMEGVGGTACIEDIKHRTKCFFQAHIVKLCATVTVTTQQSNVTVFEDLAAGCASCRERRG